MQGTCTINAVIIGNKTVQQNDISWSKQIRGKVALVTFDGFLVVVFIFGLI